VGGYEVYRHTLSGTSHMVLLSPAGCLGLLFGSGRGGVPNNMVRTFVGSLCIGGPL
jgi:hypothetical protein